MLVTAILDDVVRVAVVQKDVMIINVKQLFLYLMR